jgi:hypothetical protein
VSFVHNASGGGIWYPLSQPPHFVDLIIFSHLEHAVAEAGRSLVGSRSGPPPPGVQKRSKGKFTRVSCPAGALSGRNLSPTARQSTSSALLNCVRGAVPKHLQGLPDLQLITIRTHKLALFP